jgi:hypothetical protein
MERTDGSIPRQFGSRNVDYPICYEEQYGNDSRSSEPAFSDKRSDRGSDEEENEACNRKCELLEYFDINEP